MGVLTTVLQHPNEVPALLKMKFMASRLKWQLPSDPHRSFCYEMLQKVSRSFAVVIQQLGPNLRDAVCVFYLVLRGLDTVEDDMSIPLDTKVPILKAFHETIYDPAWRFVCGEKDYKVLMDQFHHVSTTFLNLDKKFQDVIAEITQRMGNGMAKFIVTEVETIEDYNEYCHYVAGLVGIGLSRLFHASGLEDLATDSLSNSMGLFLQKTNIIRDYLEDINEEPAPRMFWPHEIWGKYSARLADFKEEKKSDVSLACLNDMITNALEHAIDSLQYMSALRDGAIFRFCAIPQIMAIATLAACYNNIQVFRGVVKIRRGLAAKIVLETSSMKDVYSTFYDFSNMLTAKIDKQDPSSSTTMKHVENILSTCRASGIPHNRSLFQVGGWKSFDRILVLLTLVILLVALTMFARSQQAKWPYIQLS
uniref:Squalene synthase n=1 Tax=Huperzia serrata TaxID=355589 RepID=H2EQA6_HUPSR|nr:squalene synthase [Huperzia serrata]